MMGLPSLPAGRRWVQATLAVGLLVAAAAPAGAASATLTITPSSFGFDVIAPNPSTDADANLKVTAEFNTLGMATLTVLADDDFRQGAATIPISNVSWTVNGQGYVGGTLSKVAPQLVGSWMGTGRTRRKKGTLRHTLAGGYYATGWYDSVYLTYTLTAP